MNREDLRNLIRHKLGEEDVHWTNTELNLCINESLLTFGALSGFWKEDIQLITEENKVIYDIFEDTLVHPNFIKPTITYKNIFDWLNRDLLENISFAAPIAEFLDLDFYIRAIEAKYNAFQQATNLFISELLDAEIPALQKEIALPVGLVDIIRISFIFDNEEIVLDEADEEEIHLNSDDSNSNGNPLFYTRVYNKTNVIRLFPTPANVGGLRILYISAIEEEPDNEEVILRIANNLAPYIKFGVEADIFSNEGPLNDPVRAAYCKQRWEEGIMVGRNYTSVLLAKANGRPILLDSLQNVDLYSDDIKVRTSPTVLGFGGFNVFRTDVIPSEVEYSLQLTINANAKIPENDASQIEIDLEYIDSLADYVVHLAKFRNGAHEVAMTSNLKDNFLKTAINHNRRLLQAGITFDNLLGITKKQEKEQPRIPQEV